MVLMMLYDKTTCTWQKLMITHKKQKGRSENLKNTIVVSEFKENYFFLQSTRCLKSGLNKKRMTH